jgi:hypothetical protein
MYVDTTSTNVNKHRLRTLNSYAKQCGLFDLGFSDPAYTWTSKCFSSAPVFERLDRCLANVEWCNLCPNMNVFHLPIMFSDNAPIIFSTESQFLKPTFGFKFENWCTMEEDFQSTARYAWLSSPNSLVHA